MKVLSEVQKNLKIIFRSLSSLSMLVLGPLVLILLIGFAFSGDELHGIKLGVYSESPDNIKPVLKELEDFGDIITYGSVVECVADMRLEKVHICLEFSKDFIITKGEDIPTGEITFYYDNSRKKMTNAIVGAIDQFLGFAAEEISLRSAETIFGNIEKLVIYLNEKKDDLQDIRQEALEMRTALVDRLERLKQIYALFEERHVRITELHQTLTDEYELFESLYYGMSERATALRNMMKQFYSEIDLLLGFVPYNEYYVITVNGSNQLTTDAINISKYHNITNNGPIMFENGSLVFNDTIEINTTGMSSQELAILRLQALRHNVIVYINEINSFEQSTYSILLMANDTRNEINMAIETIDAVNDLLLEEIVLTEDAIRGIDVSVKNIDEITQKFDSEFEALEKINPELAEKLINPIVKMLKPLIQGMRNIELVFPMLVSVVVIFISLLFSNIITLQEIHSKAHFRNMIAPVKKSVYTSGLIMTSFLVVLFQALILLLVAQFRFKIDVFSVFWPLLLVIVLLSLIFVFIGMMIAYLFENQQTSVLTTTFVALAFFLFSDFITPLESMPVLASYLAGLNPIVLSTYLIKQLTIFNLPLWLMSKHIVMLILYLLIALVLLLIVSKKKSKV